MKLQDYFEQAKSATIYYTPKIITSIIIFIIFLTLASYVKNLLSNNNSNLMIDQLKSIIYYSIITFGCFVILLQFGVELNSLVGFLGAFIITLGLAFQTFLSNIVASFYIIFSNLFKKGDNITINGLIRGYIVDFDLFNTTLVNEDGITSFVPNSSFLFSSFQNNSIINLPPTPNK